MALDLHPPIQERNSDAQNLMVSCGVDWQIMLWQTRGGRRSPILANDLETEIFDIKWSPTHPAVFATGDGVGNLDIWDLSKDREAPKYRKTDESMKSINKLRFTNDGKKIITGNSMGVVKLWSVDNSFYQSKAEDLDRLEELIRGTF